MRHIPHVLAIAILLAGCGGPRHVPPWMRAAEKPRDENWRGGPAAMLTKYDANHDGTLTREELIAGMKAEFAAHDTHHNGCLDNEQTAEINQSRIEADQSTATPLQDWNQDGCVSYTEFSAAPYSLFSQLDRNNDGKLTAQELNPRAPAKPEGASPDAPDAPDAPEASGRPERGPGGPPPGQPPQ